MTTHRRSIIAGAGIGAVALLIAYRIISPTPAPTPTIRLSPGQYVIRAGAGVDDLALAVVGVEVRSADDDPLRRIGAVRGYVPITTTLRLGRGGWVQRDEYRHWLPERDGPAEALAPPLVSDPLIGSMWHHQKIDSPTAWNTTAGGGVVVAVVDTGVSCRHEDLAANVVTGYDAITGATGCPEDLHGHGTHTAGIVAAVANNGRGGAGVAWGARISPVRVLDPNGGGEDSDVAAGMIWAAGHGAAVMNMSLGGEWDSPSLRAASAYVIGRGVVLVAAAGNEGSSRLFYPAAYPGVISVGATNSSDRRTDWSNWGGWITMGAPGETILSTIVGGGFGSMSGTSMAAPVVAGVAALVRSLGYPAASVRQLLQTTADTCSGCGWQAGRVDAAAAVRAVPPTPTPFPGGHTRTPTVPPIPTMATNHSTPTVTATRPGYPPPATPTPTSGATPTLAPGCVRLAPWPGMVLCREVE